MFILLSTNTSFPLVSRFLRETGVTLSGSTKTLFQRAYKISMAAGDGGMSLNNYGVLSVLNNETAVANSLFRQAQDSQQGWESLWNCALIAHNKGDQQEGGTEFFRIS